MIIDKISNAEKYIGIVKNLDKAISFINGNYSLPLGRHEFDEGAVNSSEIVSAQLSEREFEAHQIYADVMFVLDGQETVSYCPVSELSVSKEYDPSADIAFYKGEGKDILVTIPNGYFYVVMPGEGHKPCIHTSAPSTIKKYVIKCKQ